MSQRLLFRRLLGFVCCAFVVFSLTAAHAREKARPAWQQQRAMLDQCVKRGEFRIFYTLAGPNALTTSDQVDEDHDGVPDRIQNIALQLITARRVFTEVLGLRHPLESPRYQQRVKFIDVNVWALEGRNGGAGDAITNYHRPSDPPEGAEVVTIDLSVKLSPRNVTPAHELFHVFQNGYSQFKNGWFMEGTARWSEYLLRAGVGSVDDLPSTTAEVQKLFLLKYEASKFWVSIGEAIDPKGIIELPEELRKTRYVGSAMPVVEDNAFHGAKLMKELLEGLARESDAISKEQGLDPFNWTEAQQRSPDNNRRIWKVVLEVCRPHAAASAKLRRMVETFESEAAKTRQGAK